MIDLRDAIGPDDYLANDPLHLDKRGIRRSMEVIARSLTAVL